MNQPKRLLQLFMAAVALVAAMPAWGQSAYDPKIAYTQLSGKTTSLYLANEDGSHAVRVHATNNGIKGIDFSPGGGRIAFTDRVGLKVLSYTPVATGIRVDGVNSLLAGSYGPPDFSADGSRILYYQSAAPSGFRAVPSTGGASVFLHTGSGLAFGRWLPADLGNAFAFLKPVTGGPQVVYEIWSVLLDANDQPVSAGPSVSTATQAFKSIEDFDIAHTRAALLISVGYPVGYPITNNIVEFDLVSGQVTDKAGAGYRAHYSADDSRIVYRTYTNLGTTEYVNSLDLGSGVISRIFASSKGLGVTDARP